MIDGKMTWSDDSETDGASPPPTAISYICSESAGSTHSNSGRQPRFLFPPPFDTDDDLMAREANYITLDMLLDEECVTTATYVNLQPKLSSVNCDEGGNHATTSQFPSFIDASGAVTFSRMEAGRTAAIHPSTGGRKQHCHCRENNCNAFPQALHPLDLNAVKIQKPCFCSDCTQSRLSLVSEPTSNLSSIPKKAWVDWRLSLPSDDDIKRRRALYSALLLIIFIVLALVFLNDLNNTQSGRKSSTQMARSRGKEYSDNNSLQRTEQDIDNSVYRLMTAETKRPRVLLITGEPRGNSVDKAYTISTEILAMTKTKPDVTTTAMSATIPPVTASTWLPTFDKDVQCGTMQFRCLKGSSRIPCLWEWERCDGIEDCSDGSDEMSCDKLDCYGNFQCASRDECVSLTRVCNGVTDCQDNSDEQNCDDWQCHDYEFRCATGYCIPKQFICDGDADCPGMEDEFNCTDSCPVGFFLCAQGHCIPKSYVCNGVVDCLDGEDERPEECGCDDVTLLKCHQGMCVRGSRCDGVRDCYDGSDEWNCVSIEVDGVLSLNDPNSTEVFPVCADHWNHGMSGTVCANFGFITSKSTRFVDLSTASASYILKPAYELWSSTSKMLVSFTKQPSASCHSERHVSIDCQQFDCGVWHRSPSRVRRVVGGHSSANHQWPSVALLYHPTKRWLCTASVIAPQWLLTSALCVRRTDASTIRWRVIVGNSQPNDTAPNVHTRRVLEFIQHPSYKLYTLLADFDVMLVKLESPLNLVESGDNIGAICLPNRRTSPKDYCVTAGWGFTTPGGYFINKQLKHLQMDTVDRSNCNATEHYGGMISSRMLCAANANSAHTPCFNDEGAPLMCHDSAKGRWYLAGVLTGHSCGSKRHPAVFADVFALKQWISQTAFSRLSDY